MAKTKNAMRIIDKMIGDDAKLQKLVARETINAAVAQIIYDARTKAGLTQSDLAELIGTKQSAIARLEDADYEGHSLTMLTRIAKALNLQLTVQMTAEEPHVDDKRFALLLLLCGLRRKLRLTVDQLAEKADVDRDEIIGLEREPGFKAEPRTLHKLAGFFELPAEGLLQLAGAVNQVPREIEAEAFGL